MDWVTIIWSMIISACGTLGLVHLMVWWQHREKIDRLLFTIVAAAVAWFAYCELWGMRAHNAADYGAALRWSHVPVWVCMVAVVAYVRSRLDAGRIWLGACAVGLRSVSLVINFLVEPNINYREITGLRQLRFLDDWISLPIGLPNPLMLIAQTALVLWLAFVVDASVSVWRRGERLRAVLFGGSIAGFISLGALQSILAHWQVIQMPAGGSLYFVIVIVLMAFDLSLETRRVAQLSVELHETKRRTEAEVTHLGRVATFGEISVTLAHEMNQPLGIILSNAQAAQRILAKEDPDLPEVRAILADIVSENLRAGEVIRRMRELLRRNEEHHTLVDLNQLADEVFAILRRRLRERQIILLPDLGADLPSVSADRVQLQQVLLNLLLNACDAMIRTPPADRHLRVTTRRVDSGVRVSVSDNGCGLPADVEWIFRPFYTTKETGLGMGLAICRSIITTHQGRLWAERGATGGAVFHFDLPSAS